MKRLVVCALLVGCGGDNGTVTVDDFGMEFAVASCAKQFDCCTDAEIMAQYMGITYDGQPITTEDQCVEFANALLTGVAVPEYKESIAAGRVEYDGDAAADCLAAVNALSCGDYGSSLNSDLAPDCSPFLIPKVSDGGGCTESFECTSHNCVGATDNSDGPDVDGTCQPMPTAGQECEDNCADGLYCGFDLTSGAKVCQALKADGADCNLDYECASDHCDDTMSVCGAGPLSCDGR
jgi:hypothetical protein